VKILFVNLSSLQFTVLTPDTAPLGGSESSLCYLARALTQRGHEISVIANLPPGAENVIEAISHYPLATLKNQGFFAATKFDAIILCNASAAVEPLKALLPDTRILLWAHILPDQPSMQNFLREKDFLDGVVCVSQWQKNEIERAFGTLANATVIGNGIAPMFENMFVTPEELRAAKQNLGAYTTTPYRGLSVLLRAMEGLDRDTKLDLFSSMRVYQGNDKDYANLFDTAERNPAITSHGSVMQRELAQHLRSSAFLFYPSIYNETFCITVAEAMAAGMEIIATRTGALPETAMGMADLVEIRSTDGDVLVKDYRAAMQRAIDGFKNDPQSWVEKMFAHMRRANEVFSWKKRAQEWEEFFGATL
jgi:glycosyltransferase involved in cell wall biosynthesis